jgi:hypothetical protein
MIYVFTSAAANYLPKVKVLFSSIRKHHPEFKLYLVLADAMSDDLVPEKINADGIVTVSELGIAKWKSWTFYHSLVELSTGIKPFMLRYLLSKKDCEAVFYFDPDIAIFSRLDDLVDQFKQNSILLTPHQTDPEKTLEAIVDNEICSLRHGIFNLGFIGVKSDSIGESFSKWWADRIYYFCIADFNRGLFVDQKWIDFVPVFFDNVKILKSTRYNVATWNLTTRKFGKNSNKEFIVDGQPLGFYHFTGFDSGAHEIMAGKYAGNNSAVKDLIRWYKESIRVSREADVVSWAFSSFDNGAKITPAHRQIYRMRKDLQDAFPDPFSVIDDKQCYYNWFQWHAAKEYPELVAYKDKTETVLKAHPAVSTKFKWSNTWKYIKRAAQNPRRGIQLGRNAIIILSHEGFKGLKRHMNSGL